MIMDLLAFIGAFYIGKTVFDYFYPNTHYQELTQLLESQLQAKSTRLKELEEQLECILNRTRIN